MNFIARFLFELQEMSLLAGRSARGIFKILNLGAYVQPFRAQYTYATTDVVTAFTAGDDQEYYVYFAGLKGPEWPSIAPGLPTAGELGSSLLWTSVST